MIDRDLALAAVVLAFVAGWAWGFYHKPRQRVTHLDGHTVVRLQRRARKLQERRDERRRG